MGSFQNSIQQMLWPEKREKDSVLGDKVPGVIARTTARSYLRVPAAYLPAYLEPLLGFGDRFFPNFVGGGGIQIGPIPAGTPVDILANLNLEPETTSEAERLAYEKKMLELLIRIKHDLSAIPAGASDDEARKVLANLADPLWELSKCPDFVINRGHYFGTSYYKDEPALSDSDKQALIAFLETF